MNKTIGKMIVQGALAAVALAFASGSAYAADEVKLLKVKSTHTVYKNSYHSGRFEALVANLAYAKNVAIWLKKTDGQWTAVPMSFNRQGPAGKEVWALDFANTLPPTPDTMEFAVRYTVNGQTYWDNNNGQNYKVAHEAGSVLFNGLNVYNGSYQPTYNLYGGSTTLGGSVTVKNLAATKSVQVHYSTDNWASTQVVNATFNADYWRWGYSSVSNPNAYGFEEWSFSLPVGNANQVKYAIKYVVNGQTYWDNNFGQNYTSNLVRY